MARGAYLARPRQHARPREPLVQAGVRRAAVPAWRGRGGALSVPVDDAARACLSQPRRWRGAEAGRLRPRREHPLGRHRDDRRRHVRVLLARQPQPQRGRLQEHLAPVVGAVPDHLDHLPAGRAAALAHDLDAPGAGARGASAARRAHDPDERGRAVPGRRAGVQGADRQRRVRRLGGAVLGARGRGARVRGELLRPRLARRPPVVRAVRRARAARVGLALHVRAGRRAGDRLRPDAPSRSASPRRRWCRWRSCRGRSAATARAPRPRSAARCARARASPARCWRSWSPSRRCSTARCWWSTRPRPTPRSPASCSTSLLITRAPLQLFQAIQTSLLPHLSGLHATGGGADFDRAIRDDDRWRSPASRAPSCSASG